MKYLKKFTTHSDYEEYINGDTAILPNVSICEDNPESDHVHYSPWVKPPVKALKFTANGDSTLGMRIGDDLTLNLSASTDGDNWSVWNGETINIPDGESVYIKGDNPYKFSTSSSTKYAKFTMDGSIACEGNVMHLLGENVTEIPCDFCFYCLFNGCTDLTTAPELPATTLKNNCYRQMFGSTNLSVMPELPATVMKDRCYQFMFTGCENLVTVKELPATTLSLNCYYGMFSGCTSLIEAQSILPATNLAESCYYGMFTNCINLTSGPELPANKLEKNCYHKMFFNCTNFDSVKMLATDISASGCTHYWLSGTSNTGTIELSSEINYNPYYNQTGLLTGMPLLNNDWDIILNGERESIFFTANELSTIEMVNLDSDKEYAVAFVSENRINWERWNGAVKTISDGESIYFCGVQGNYAGCKFVVDGDVSCGGNLKNLCGYYSTDEPLIAGQNTFKGLFMGCTGLTDASELIIPQCRTTGFKSSVFESLFSNCTNLVYPPTFIATIVYTLEYAHMFSNCTKLSISPSLPATGISEDSYFGMFENTNLLPDCSNINFENGNGCAGLFYGTKVTDEDLMSILPKNQENGHYWLPCSSVTTYAYQEMFAYCTGLTTAPELPATTVAEGCYQSMFYGCTSLTTAPYILPATTLAKYCYMNMFERCTSLTVAPILPAETLKTGCYKMMFAMCSNLISITCLAIGDIDWTSAAICMDNWLTGVGGGGTFTTPASTNWPNNYNGIPSSWTRVDA